MSQGMYLHNGQLHFNGAAVPQHCYHPNNFTYKMYETWLRKAQESGFSFVGMAEKHNKSKTVVLRHDIPLSLEAAFHVSGIDADHGVRSIFFIDPQNPFYSLDEPLNQAMLQGIFSRGHDIGIKISVRDDQGQVLSDEAIGQKIKALKTQMESYGATTVSFAFDVTGIDRERLKELAAIKVDGLINAYGHTFTDGIDRSKSYNSDSNGMNLYGKSRFDMLTEGVNHQHVLVHPEWLSATAKSPYDRLLEHVGADHADRLAPYLALTHATGRCVVGDGFNPVLDAHFKALLEGKAPAFADHPKR